MIRLLDQAKINHNALKRDIVKFAGTELNALVAPCYYPQVKKYYYSLMDDCGLTEPQIKKFAKEYYAGSKYSHLNLVIDPISNLNVMIMYYFLKNRDQVGFNMIMIYHAVRTYTNLMHKQIRYCDPNAFRYALEHLNKTHLFVREKTIPGAIYFLSQEMVKQYAKPILNNDREQIAIFLQGIRHRISQSVKSFAEAYYKAKKEGHGIKEIPMETDDEGVESVKMIETSRTDRLIDEVVSRITIYKEVDKKALEEAKNLTKISADLSLKLAEGLRDLKYADNIGLILKLFTKGVTSVNIICGKEYYVYIKSLMSIKRTSASIYFKQQVAELLELLIKDLGQEKFYKNLSNQTRFLINYFLAYYITMLLRNKLC